MPEYEAMKAALELGRRADEEFARTHRREKMTLHDFELALHKLLDEATAAGLPADEVQEVAEAIVNNTFLDDPEAV